MSLDVTQTLRRARTKQRKAWEVFASFPNPWPFQVSIERTPKLLSEFENSSSDGLPVLPLLRLTDNLQVAEFFNLTGALSGPNTSQGRVFEAELVQRNETAKKGSGSAASLSFALKKSLLPRQGDWEAYVVCLAYALEKSKRTPAATQLAKEGPQRAFLKEDRELSPERLVVRLRQRIVERWFSPSSEPIVDAVASVALSELVRRKLSFFHPLVYCTSRCYDSAWYTAPTSEQTDTGRVQVLASQTWPPVQLLMMETLDGTLRDLCKTVFSGGVLFRWDILNAFLAQIVWGLAIAQQHHRFVNNDAHWNNIMFRRVAPNSYLCFSAFGRRFRVPTHGYLLVMIDPGRASLVYRNRTYTSEYMTRSAIKHPVLNNPNTDLVRTAMEVTRLLKSCKVPDFTSINPNETNAHKLQVLAILRRWRTVMMLDTKLPMDLETKRQELQRSLESKIPASLRGQEKADALQTAANKAQNDVYVWSPVDPHVGWAFDATPHNFLTSFTLFETYERFGNNDLVFFCE